jgi:hypothetical protein
LAALKLVADSAGRTRVTRTSTRIEFGNHLVRQSVIWRQGRVADTSIKGRAGWAASCMTEDRSWVRSSCALALPFRGLAALGLR